MLGLCVVAVPLRAVQTWGGMQREVCKEALELQRVAVGQQRSGCRPS